MIAWKADQSNSDEFDESHDRIRRSLYHSHLPKLADARLIEYDREQGIVAAGEAIDAAEPYLELTKQE